MIVGICCVYTHMCCECKLLSVIKYSDDVIFWQRVILHAVNTYRFLHRREEPGSALTMKSTKVLNPRRCIMRVTRNTHARTREKRMLYRYAATSFSETVNTRASYVGR